MIPSLIKNCPKRPTLNHHAFTLVELMIAVGFSVLLLTGVYGFYTAASQSYSAGISGQALQDGADIALSKIIAGGNEPGGAIFRLASGYSSYIPNGNPNTLYYCQDSPCSAADPTARWYALDATNTQIQYHHPTSNPLGYDVIYQAPKGSSFFNTMTNSKTLRFSYAQEINPAPPPATVTLPNVIEIDIALTENLSANVTNQKMQTSGAASTFVLLRNHS